MSKIMQNLVVLMEPSERAYDTPLKGGNMILNRFCIDEDAAFELSGVNYLKKSCREMILAARKTKVQRNLKGKEYSFFRSDFNSHAYKKFTPHNSSWFCRIKGFDFAKVTRDWIISEH